MNHMDIRPGYYKARGVAGTDQFGYASGGGEQISLELDVQLSDQETRRLTTILAFAGKAQEYSIERLKALGWDGSNSLNGIDRNEVDVEVKYEANPQKPQDPPQMRVEIKTNGGRFTFKKPMAEPEKRGFLSNLSKVAAQLGATTPANGSPAPRNAMPPAQGGGYPPSWDTNGPPQKPVL